MPQTFSLAANSAPYHLPVDLPAAYAMITNLHADIAVINGEYQEPSWTLYYAVWPSLASFEAGSPAGLSASATVTTSSPLMPAFDTLLATVLTSLPGVSNIG